MVATAVLALLLPAAAQADLIYWTNPGKKLIQHADLDGSGVTTLFSGEGHPQCIALDPAAGKIYWTNYKSEEVSVGSLDGTGTPETLFEEGGPGCIALDSAAGKVYLNSWVSDKISVGNLDGTGTPETLFKGEDQPAAIAPDPAAGKLYWTDYGSGKIQVGNLDGTGTPETLFEGERAPQGIAIDVAARKVYWLDSNPSGAAGEIRVANLDGSGAPETLFEGGHSLAGIALDPAAGKLYWVEEGPGKIQVANLDGSGTPETLLEPESPDLLALLDAPRGTGAPVVSGGGQPGEPLTCSSGTWAADLPSALLYRAPREVAYEWLRGGLPIAGATRASYTPVGPGSYVCRETASNQAGDGIQMSAAVRVTAPSSGPGPSSSSPAPGAKQPPFNAFRIRKLHHRLRSGTVRMRLWLPGPGKVRLRGPRVRPVWRTVHAQGWLDVVVRPRRRLSVALKHGRTRARVRVSITFSPAGGTPRTRVKGMTLRRRLHVHAPQSHGRVR